MKRKATALALTALACVCAWLGLNATKNAAFAWLLAVVCIALAVLIWKGKRSAAPKKQGAQPAAPAYSFISFHLSGVTFPNDEGIDRQELLRQIDEGLPPFENGGELDINLKPVKFKGEDAIECRVNGRQIGFVPKAMVPDVLAAMRKPDYTISDYQVVGGKDGINYGFSMAVRFTNKQAARRRDVLSFDAATVYVVENGRVYHRASICQHALGRNYTSMTRAQAKKQGLKPCKKCYPYGD